jgi:hypothetical protein
MPKIVNVRERVHQPFRDTLCRLSGYTAGTVQDTTRLFTVAGKPVAQSNLANGSTLPSDQSMVILVLRVFTWFRASVQRGGLFTLADNTSQILLQNGDWTLPTAAGSPAFAAALNGQAIANYRDIYRLHHQAEEQLLWTMGAGSKPSLEDMPTAYFPGPTN